MSYMYEYLVFEGDKPSKTDIEKALRDHEQSMVAYQNEQELDNLAEDLVNRNLAEWELWDDGHIYVSVFPYEKPNEMETFKVQFWLDFKCLAEAV